MNDTVGPYGLVPSTLVFGTIRRFPPHSTPLLSHTDRMRAMQIERLEMAEINAQLRVQRELREKVPPESEYLFRPGDKVYVWHAGNNQKNGPYTVTKTFKNNIWAQRPDFDAKYTLDHILPANHADGTSLTTQIQQSLATLFTKASEPTSACVYLIEILEPCHPRKNDPRFAKARLKQNKSTPVPRYVRTFPAREIV